MTPFTTMTGIAAPLLLDNIDTDLIIPGRFLKTVVRTGLGDGLFDSLRRDPRGTMRQDFVLNQPAFQTAQILIVGDNFGCGSSREHAPWALLDYGIRCVIGTGFSDIFFSNSMNCGLLLAKISRNGVTTLATAVSKGYISVNVDLLSRCIRVGDDICMQFDVPSAARVLLIEGLDQIEHTLSNIVAIERYENRYRFS